MRWRFWRRRPRLPYNWLRERTGRDETEWVLRVQELISSSWRDNPADAKHPISYPAQDWIVPLAREVDRRVLARTRGGDENIGVAIVLGYILLVWGGRIARAKAMDPHRPAALRRDAYRRWQGLLAQVVTGLTDESRDPEMFEQPWESPFLPDATDGDFV